MSDEKTALYFAQRLKEARKAAGISQQAMADKMLIPKRTIEKWEIGERVPPEYVQRFVLNELEVIGQQRRSCKEAAEQNGFVVVSENIDDETGEQPECPQFDKMMQRVKRGDFKSVISLSDSVDDPDREKRQ